jgi:Ca2+-binding EF-hand superfamily protein
LFSFNETNDLQYLSADEADRIIQRKAVEQLDDITKAFLAFDRDGNGIVTKKESRKVLYRYHIPLTKEEFKKLWAK